MIKQTQQNVHGSTEMVSVRAFSIVLPSFTTLQEKYNRNPVDRKRLFKSKRKEDAINFPRRCEKIGLVKACG